MSRAVLTCVLSLNLFACASGGRTPGAGGGGGEEETGGATGGSPGTGGAKPPGTGGATGGSPGTGGMAEAGTGGSTISPDAAATGGTMAQPDGGSPPAATGQGPVAEGKIAFSNDFEVDMHGMSRSPNGLPEDRIQIVDDPINQRGKVVRIHYMQGDNFRTSGGTEPRSWFSSAMGYTIRPGTTVSISWGFMWENVNMGAHFAQIIRDGGPLWMWDVDANGVVSAVFHRGKGGTGPIMKLEPMKWYDFMVVTDYKAGGVARFYVNGKMVGMGTGDGGAAGRWDCGIYTRAGAHPGRTVYLSNISIGEL